MTSSSSLGAVAEGRRLTYLSLGAGVQSSALYVMTTLGLHGCPGADVAIFADTQDEPAYVYEQVDRLRAWGVEHHGPRIDTVTAGHLSGDIISRHRDGKPRHFAAIPVFSSNGDGGTSMLSRQCASDYKITPIKRHVRKCLGLRFRQRAKGKVKAVALIGFSLDEASRMKPSREDWITNVYPLIDARLRRKDCLEIVTAVGLPAPKKSACVFCPFHDDAYWLWMKTEHPEEFERAANVDEQIRDMSRSGIARPVFVHRSLQPLRMIDFAERRRLPLFESDQFQNECEGVCGV